MWKTFGKSLCFALPSGFMKEREVQTEIPLSRTCLMSGKHRGCSQHIWHLNPCRSWDAIQLPASSTELFGWFWKDLSTVSTPATYLTWRPPEGAVLSIWSHLLQCWKFQVNSYLLPPNAWPINSFVNSFLKCKYLKRGKAFLISHEILRARKHKPHWVLPMRFFIHHPPYYSLSLSPADRVKLTPSGVKWLA